MPALTRRPNDDPHRTGWHVYYGDVHVGAIGTRAGVPVSAPQWQWSCGFYPGLEPGQRTSGVAEDFETARAGFEDDWRRLMPQLSENAFEEWRQTRAFHAWKEKMWECGRRLPTQERSGRSACFCGAAIDMETADRHILDAHPIRGAVSARL
jgi:hypothetical protein